MSLACVLYLTSSLDLVDSQVPERETHSQVVQCFHDLQLYVNDHWLDHLSALAHIPTDSIPRGSSMLSLNKGLERLIERHNKLARTKAWNAQNDGGSHPSASEAGWPQLGFSAASQNLLDKALYYRSKSVEGDQITSSSCMYEAVPLPLILSDTHYALYSRSQSAGRPNAILKHPGPLSKHTGGGARTQHSERCGLKRLCRPT